MTDPVFGEGLEAQLPPVVETPPVLQQQPVVPATPDPLIELLKSRGYEVPDGTTADEVLNHFSELQNTNKTYSEKLAEYQAQQQQFVANQVKTQQEQQAAQSAAEKKVVAEARKYAKSVVDPDLLPLVTADPNGRGFVPKNPMNPAHIAAAEHMSQLSSSRSRIGQDLADDPYAFVGECARPIIDQMNQTWEERYKTLEAKLSPFEAYMQEQAQAKAVNTFTETHASRLYDSQGQLTPLGKLTNEYLTQHKMPVEQAFAMAEMAATNFGIAHVVPIETPPAKPPVSISKVAAPSQRFSDLASNGSRQRLQEKPDSGVGDGKELRSAGDLARKYNLPTSPI